jgi:molybdate transport system substrate-binding protein
MQLRSLRVLAALCLSLVSLACSPKKAEPASVQIFAAASLRDACGDVAQLWRERRPEVELVFNFGSSATLAQQIEATRAADLFLSADTAQMELVRKSGAIAVEGPARWLSNQLVVVVPASSSEREWRSANELVHERFPRLSLANPASVPAGKYARAWLEAHGSWSALEARVVPAVDVRAALAAVENAACEVGVVYSTDAAASPRVRVVYRVPLEQGPRIDYAIAATRGKAPAPLAREVLEHFLSPAAEACFASRGFLVRERD